MIDIINNSYNLLSLKKDWDGDGGDRICQISYYYAIYNFLIKYYDIIPNLIKPSISPLSSGYIDIVFDNGKHRLLICIKKYNASHFNNFNNFGGSINLKNDKIDNFIFELLKNKFSND